MSDGPQGSGALNLRGRSAERAAQARQGDPLVRGEVDPKDLSGGATWDTSGHEDHRTTMPHLTANDPLVLDQS